eukprot:8926296-Pyramimonas_sp.AAC.1
MDLLTSSGPTTVRAPGPARTDIDNESQIDVLACPVRQTCAYEVRKLWRLTLSDHALIALEPQ